jgi:hypothetical protein
MARMGRSNLCVYSFHFHIHIRIQKIRKFIDCIAYLTEPDTTFIIISLDVVNIVSPTTTTEGAKK